MITSGGSSGTGTPGTDGPTNGETGNPGGGGVGNSSSSNNTFTAPVATIDYKGKVLSCLGDSLDIEAQFWVQNPDNDQDVFFVVRSIALYLRDNAPNSSSCPSQEVLAFAAEAIEAKLNSPFNVDLFDFAPDDNIDLAEVETNEKFMCIYKKLTQSPKFKDLFIDTFGESENLNVKFEIVDIPPITINGEVYSPNGDCVITNYSPTTGLVTSVDVKIRIDNNYINNATSFDIARTVLHESIHAYLQLKMKNCNLGTSINDLNNTSLESLLSQYFDNCAAGQEEHEFMFDELIPTMQIILTQIRDLFLTSQEIAEAEISPAIFQNETTSNGLPNTSWDWQQFYYYFSLNGLNNTQAFQDEILNSVQKSSNFFDYKVYANSNFNNPCID